MVNRNHFKLIGYVNMEVVLIIINHFKLIGYVNMEVVPTLEIILNWLALWIWK